MTEKNIFDQKLSNIEVSEETIVIRSEEDRRTKDTLTLNKRRENKECRRKREDIFKE